MQKNKAILFVYNSNSGPKNTFVDGLQKVLSPKTYDCNLCKLTYGVFSEDKKWKAFRKQSDIEMLFMHKDEYQRKFKSKFEALYDLPVILYQDNYDLSLLIGKEELNRIEDIDTLIQKIKTRL